MYEKIQHPKTGKWHNINSSLGNKLVKGYAKKINQTGGNFYTQLLDVLNTYQRLEKEYITHQSGLEKYSMNQSEYSNIMEKLVNVGDAIDNLLSTDKRRNESHFENANKTRWPSGIARIDNAIRASRSRLIEMHEQTMVAGFSAETTGYGESLITSDFLASLPRGRPSPPAPPPAQPRRPTEPAEPFGQTIVRPSRSSRPASRPFGETIVRPPAGPKLTHFQQRQQREKEHQRRLAGLKQKGKIDHQIAARAAEFRKQEAQFAAELKQQELKQHNERLIYEAQVAREQYVADQQVKREQKKAADAQEARALAEQYRLNNAHAAAKRAANPWFGGGPSGFFRPY